MFKLHCELVVCRADLEELSSCLYGLLHEDQVVCEQRDRWGGGDERRTEIIQARQEDVMGEGKRGQ